MPQPDVAYGMLKGDIDNIFVMALNESAADSEEHFNETRELIRQQFKDILGVDYIWFSDEVGDPRYDYTRRLLESN